MAVYTTIPEGTTLTSRLGYDRAVLRHISQGRAPAGQEGTGKQQLSAPVSIGGTKTVQTEALTWPLSADRGSGKVSSIRWQNSEA